MLNSVFNGDWSNSVPGRQIPEGAVADEAIGGCAVDDVAMPIFARLTKRKILLNFVKQI